MVDLLASGYPCLDFILPVSYSPQIGETAFVGEMPIDHEATFNGSSANIATTLAKLGFETALATVVGGDRAGYIYTSKLRRQGVDVKDTVIMREGYTSRSYRFRNPNGEYQTFFFAGVADDWDGTLDLVNMLEAKYALLSTSPRHYSREFIREARKAGKPIIWQQKSDVVRHDAEMMAMCASTSDYILMARREVEFILEQLGLAGVRDLLAQDTQAVVVINNDGSCTLYDQAGQLDIQAVPVPQAVYVDAIGLDDAFTAGFVAGLLKEYSFRECARVGAVVASFVVEGIGGQANLPNWQEMQTRYEKHFGSL